MRFILLFTTIVAGALRFPFLGHQSLWFDETFTREIVRQPTLVDLWRHVGRTESTPPLYYLLCWLVRARSAVAMRAISAVALTAAVPVSYAAFHRLVGTRAALASAAILGVNPMLVEYSTDARSYGLFVLTGLLTIWAFSTVLERASSKRYMLWALASVACMWTHYFGVFLVIAEALILLASSPGARIKVLGWLLFIGICVAPLMPLVSHQAGSELAAFIEAEPLASRFFTTVRQSAMGANVPHVWLEGAGLFVWCLAIGLGAVTAISGGRGSRLVLMLAAVSVSFPLLIGVVGIEDRFYARNVIVAVPMAAALAAPVMLRLRAVPLACYLLLALAAAAWVATDWRYEQVDWRDAISRVEALNSTLPLDAVMPDSAPVVSIYLHRKAVASAGLTAKKAWVIVAPVRGPHDRALTLAPMPVLNGFDVARELGARGFRLILVAAPRPTRIWSGEIPDSTVFGQSTLVMRGAGNGTKRASRSK